MHYFEHAFEQFHTVRAVVTRVVGGVEMPDVLFAERGEYGVHKRVHGDVASECATKE